MARAGAGPRAQGPAGVKASRKEALVRHRTGWWGGSSPNVPPASPTGSGEQLGRLRKAGPGGSAHPWAPPRSPQGRSGPIYTRVPRTPNPAASKGPRLSLDIIAFLPLCGEGLDCPRQASLSPRAPGHCPLGVASHEVSPEKAASDRGSGAGAGCLQVPSQKFRQDPQLHATPLAGACVD